MKLDMTIVPRELKKGAARSMGKNITKYPTPTWKELSYRIHLAAAERHLDELIDGKEFDEEGDSHLDNLTARIGFLQWLKANKPKECK